MLLNHARQRVEEFRDGESLCPLCKGDLIARRGEIVIWHWAHRAMGEERTACPWLESQWHLAWKDAYSSYAGWQIEHPVDIDGHSYVLDAINLDTGRVREFVHSLSPYYSEKHRRLLQVYPDVRWLFDGMEFASRRLERCRDGRGVRNFLKPRALLAADELDPRVGVHVGLDIFKRWRENVWYPVENSTARHITERFSQVVERRYS